MGDLNRSVFHLIKVGMAWGGAIIRVRLEWTPWGQNAATIRVIPKTIIEVRPGALGQILHPPEDDQWDT